MYRLTLFFYGLPHKNRGGFCSLTSTKLKKACDCVKRIGSQAPLSIYLKQVPPQEIKLVKIIKEFHDVLRPYSNVPISSTILVELLNNNSQIQISKIFNVDSETVVKIQREIQAFNLKIKDEIHSV
tara:strand:+ start:413 stop:790 length:378 start_codon:yes stop_codon:yes gene_type:complete